jgi:hypothetical protein
MAYPHDLDPEGTRLPVRFDGTSNGEFVPLQLTAIQRSANALAHDLATENSRRLGIGRRAFLTSTMGTAAVLARTQAPEEITRWRTGPRSSRLPPLRR